MKWQVNVIALIAVLLFTTACVLVIDQQISAYKDVAHSINIGDSKQSVLTKLLPIFQKTDDRREADSFVLPDGRIAYIFYMRSSHIADGRLTDDELTPYSFVNDQLVAIGWQALGGQSRLEASPEAN